MVSNFLYRNDVTDTFCNCANIHTVVSSPQDALAFQGLFLTALGLGGIWPCVPIFGADQFNDTDGAEKEPKEIYYNWYYVSVNGGFLFASTVRLGSGQLWLGIGFWDSYCVFSSWSCRVSCQYEAVQVSETRRKRAN